MKMIIFQLNVESVAICMPLSSVSPGSTAGSVTPVGSMSLPRPGTTALPEGASGDPKVASLQQLPSNSSTISESGESRHSPSSSHLSFQTVVSSTRGGGPDLPGLAPDAGSMFNPPPLSSSNNHRRRDHHRHYPHPRWP